MQRLLLFALLISGCAISLSARQDALQEASAQYPIKAHIVAVEMETGATTTGSSGGNYNMWGSVMHVPDTRRNVTYQWHLMKTVIGDKMYGLSAPAGRHTAWLEIGYYAFKRVKDGFQVRYRDDKGNVRQEVLTIRSEEPAPPEN